MSTDFAPIARVALSPLLLFASPTFAANNVRELITLASEEPGRLSAGTPGIGTPHHLGLLMLNALAKIDIVNVPYRGAALVGERCARRPDPDGLGAPTAVMPHVVAGKLKLLGVASAQRVPSLPQVPTIAESGVPGFDLDIWFGLAAPAKTPPELVARLSKEIAGIVAEPDFKTRIEKVGLTPAYLGASRIRCGNPMPTTSASARSSRPPASSRTDARSNQSPVRSLWQRPRAGHHEFSRKARFQAPDQRRADPRRHRARLGGRTADQGRRRRRWKPIRPAGPSIPGTTPSPAGLFHMRWPWWRDVLMETYEALNKDRLLAVAAGVVFYALLAIFPAITAFVSSYGLFAKTGAIQDDLSMLANILPAGGITIVREQIDRIANQPSGLSIGFAVGLLVALWSANAGVKAMMDALNVIVGQEERRSFVRLNLLSLEHDARRHCVPDAGGRRGGGVSAGDVDLRAQGLHRHHHLADPLAAAAGADGRHAEVFYRFGPSREHAPRWWFSPGALIAALLWLAGSAALSFYLSNFADYNATYGSLGAAIGLMMWMWLSTMVVLLGAQLDTVIERKMPPQT